MITNFSLNDNTQKKILKHKISIQEFKKRLDNVMTNRETYLRYIYGKKLFNFQN